MKKYIAKIWSPTASLFHSDLHCELKKKVIHLCLPLLLEDQATKSGCNQLLYAEEDNEEEFGAATDVSGVHG